VANEREIILPDATEGVPTSQAPETHTRITADALLGAEHFRRC